MNLLAISDEYEELAEFGSLNLYDEMVNKANVEEIRIRAFRRLINHLIRVCNNSYFALKEAQKKKLSEIVEELKGIRDNIGTYFIIVNDAINNIKRIKLNNDFSLKLERVSELKKEINIYLNEGDLIFIHKDNFDVKDYKKKIFQDAIERG
jgi:UDP-2,3-diacylglucosamine pyrophosphatase LpxH